MMASAIAEHASKHGVKTMALHRPGGRARRDVLQRGREVRATAQITMVANERFNRTDPSVTGQMLKILATKPDAVVVGAAGTPAALPPKTLRERGYKGQDLSQSRHGQQRLPARVRRRLQRHVPARRARCSVAAQLPEDHPAKRLALAYIALYEAKLRAQARCRRSALCTGTRACCSIMRVPIALKAAEPGTPEFRRALRDALETTRGLADTNGVVNMTPHGPPRSRSTRTRDGRNPERQVGLSAALSVKSTHDARHARLYRRTDRSPCQSKLTATTRFTRTTGRFDCVAIQHGVLEVVMSGEGANKSALATADARMHYELAEIWRDIDRDPGHARCDYSRRGQGLFGGRRSATRRRHGDRFRCARARVARGSRPRL